MFAKLLAPIHAAYAGAALRSWRDEQIASHLSGTSSGSWRNIQYTTLATLLVTSCTCGVLAGSWWVLACLLLAALWGVQLVRTKTWGSAPIPWWVLLPAAVTSPLSIAVTVVGALAGLFNDLRLHTLRHTIMLASLAAAASTITAPLPLPARAITAVAWVGWFGWNMWRLLLQAGRKEPTPPADMRLDAAARITLATKRRGRRPEPKYATWQRLLGDGPVLADTVMKDQGLAGEMTTGRILASLPTGCWVAHDLTLPGARDANVDHLVFQDGLAWLIETKTYGSAQRRSTMVYQGGSLAIMDPDGNVRDLSKVVQQTQWAANAVSQALGVPVRPVVAVHRAHTTPAFVGNPQLPVLVAAATDLPALIAPTTSGLRLAKKARKILVAAKGGKPAILPTSGAVTAPLPLPALPVMGGQVASNPTGSTYGRTGA